MAKWKSISFMVDIPMNTSNYGSVPLSSKQYALEYKTAQILLTLVSRRIARLLVWWNSYLVIMLHGAAHINASDIIDPNPAWMLPVINA